MSILEMQWNLQRVAAMSRPERRMSKLPFNSRNPTGSTLLACEYLINFNLGLNPRLTTVNWSTTNPLARVAINGHLKRMKAHVAKTSRLGAPGVSKNVPRLDTANTNMFQIKNVQAITQCVVDATKQWQAAGPSYSSFLPGLSKKKRRR